MHRLRWIGERLAVDVFDQVTRPKAQSGKLPFVSTRVDAVAGGLAIHKIWRRPNDFRQLGQVFGDHVPQALRIGSRAHRSLAYRAGGATYLQAVGAGVVNRKAQVRQRTVLVQHDTIRVDGVQSRSAAQRIADRIDFLLGGAVGNDGHGKFRQGRCDGALKDEVGQSRIRQVFIDRRHRRQGSVIGGCIGLTEHVVRGNRLDVGPRPAGRGCGRHNGRRNHGIAGGGRRYDCPNDLGNLPADDDHEQQADPGRQYPVEGRQHGVAVDARKIRPIRFVQHVLRGWNMQLCILSNAAIR